MALFQKKIGPVFLKKDSDSSVFIEKLEQLAERATGELAETIEKQINIARYGEMGENNIIFELKNSSMDMYIIHDLCLAVGDLFAQIDFLVITRKCVYIIECKNLIGNIDIDNSGAFVRTYSFHGKREKEGIYSPITQNERHMQVIKEVRKESRKNVVTKYFFDKYFDENYQSIVVLANAKTCLNAKYAPKDIKEQVIRADQLITHIRKQDLKSNNHEMSNDEMLELANFFLDKDIPERSDYAQKYEEMLGQMKSKSNEENVCGTDDVIRRLKEFRLTQSHSERIKPYYIFNDAQMNELIQRMPKNKEELLKVSGFGNVKVEKYGDEILRIIHSSK